MSNYLENKLIDFLFRGVSYTPPTTLYIALCTSTPTEASTGSTITEVTGGNYGRVAVTSNTTNWSDTSGTNNATSSGTGGTSNSSSIISWTSVTWTATVNSMAICDASTGGNVLFYAPLTASQAVNSGDSISFAINALSIQLDN